MNTRIALISTALVLALAAPAPGAGPLLWLQSGVEDFAAGEVVSLAIDVDGALRLAPPLATLAEAPEPRMWALAADGDTLFMAAGEEGRVYRSRGGAEAELIFDLEELGAQALALGPDGHLYVAAGPRGGIYRVPVDHDGSPLEPWFVPQTTYVWDLVFGPDGSLWVATGGDGKILRVDSSGSGTVVYDTPEMHVTALAFDPSGNLLAGTDGEGLIYRISPDDDVFVLYDSPLREITDLEVAVGGIWASAFGSEAPSSDNEDAVRSSLAAGDGEGGARGAVFLIEPDGYARELWRSTTEGAFALAPTADGVILASGPDGALLRVRLDGRSEMLARTEADQVVALQRSGDRVLVATSNPGRVLALGPGTRDEGEFLSAVHDTATISRWGTVRWFASRPSGATVEIATRSGNTATPDDTWSDWSDAYADPDGSAVSSPAARFLQWRGRLRAGDERASPRLHRVEIAYVTRNLPPRIDEITVHPAGVVYRQASGFEDGLPFAQLPPVVARALRDTDPASVGGTTGGRAFLGRPFYIAGLQTFTWQASDPQDDALTYALEFRGEADDSWRPLVTELAEPQYVLDTRRFPDGTYLVRVSASDGSSHPVADALEAHRVSRPFRVDNTPPVVSDLRATPGDDRVLIEGSLHDVTSLIDSVQYSVDGAPWHTVVPADGVADSARETIAIDLQGLDPGSHVVVVRVTDTALNEGAGRVVFESR